MAAKSYDGLVAYLASRQYVCQESLGIASALYDVSEKIIANDVKLARRGKYLKNVKPAEGVRRRFDYALQVLEDRVFDLSPPANDVEKAEIGEVKAAIWLLKEDWVG
jgi:hypothetical protein